MSVRFKIDIIDRDGFEGYAKNFPKRSMKLIKRKMFELSNELRNRTILAMQNTKTDSARAYRRGGGRIHNPSLPYNPPAVDSGNYIRSIYTQKTSFGGWLYVTGVPYAGFLEEGTKRMTERPVWANQVNLLDIEKQVSITVERDVI